MNGDQFKKVTVKINRSISMSSLKSLLTLHVTPINGFSYRDLKRVLISRWASYLDAFSSYPLHTWLPSVCRWNDNW